jgi:hypothetical protein
MLPTQTSGLVHASWKWRQPTALAGLLQTTIDDMKQNASKLQSPPSAHEISVLTQACNTFRDAKRKYEGVKEKVRRKPKLSQKIK